MDFMINVISRKVVVVRAAGDNPSLAALSFPFAVQPFQNPAN